MATIRSFRDPRVFQAAFSAGMRIFRLSRGWPREERYELTGQIRRSSRSVCACTAEAWRKRRYPAAFVAKLNDAEAEAAETRVWLDMALACGYMAPAEHHALDREYNAILAQLVHMIDHADQWAVGPPNAQSPSPRSEKKEANHRLPSGSRSVSQSRRSSPERTP